MTEVSALSYVCSDGDVLDAIVAGHYGDTAGKKVERVLAFNPGLAALGAVLSAGVVISLPVFDDEPDPATVQLWD